VRPATKHLLFFAFLLVSLAALVAFAVWHWRWAERQAARRSAPVPVPCEPQGGTAPLPRRSPPEAPPDSPPVRQSGALEPGGRFP